MSARWFKFAFFLSLIFCSESGIGWAAFDPSVNLTKTDRDWIAEFPEVVVGMSTGFPPIEFTDTDGEHVGIAVDYMNLLGKSLGIRFTVSLRAGQEEVLQAARDRKIDLVAAVSPTFDLNRYLEFTKPYLEIPAVIIVRKNVSDSLTLSRLEGKKVAVAGPAVRDYLVRYFPEIDVETAPDIPTGLRWVSFGKVDAMVDSVASTSHYIEQEKITNLRVAGDSGYVFRLSIGVRKDRPRLVYILEKGFRIIRQEEKRAIFRKWISLEKEPWKPGRDLVITVLLGLAGLAAVGVLAINFMLKNQVDLRTGELKKELHQRQEIETRLREKMEQDRLLGQISHGFLDREYHPAVETALAAIGTFFNTDRAFVFIYGEDRTTACCAHEWCRDGVPRFTPEILHTSVSKFEVMHKTLTSGLVWTVENVSDMAPEERELQRILERQSVKSLIHVPMSYRGQVIGFTGLDSVNDPFIWSVHEVEILRTLGELIAMSRVRHQAEIDIVKAKEDSEKANLAKSRFLSSMSHELRTPLNGILGFTDLLRGQYFGPLNEKQSDFVRQIDEGGKHLLSLINDLLDIAKIDAGQTKLEPEGVDIAGAVQSVHSIMRTQFEKKGISLQSRIDPGLPILQADLRKFKQVLFNLFSNAVKYTQEEGVIEVWTEIPKDSSLKIFVRDSGIGIKPDELDKIFSEFYQADQIRDGQLGGTGIGLSLTRRLMELHGGQIGVESELGKGSTFWVRFPASRLIYPSGKEAIGTSAPSTVTDEGRTFSEYRILLVEDNEVNISMMLNMLSIQGFEVVVARNGLEAIQKAKENKMDLILMDMKMPVMNGFEATNLLRSMPVYAKTPIIALTASTGTEAEERQMKIGCTEHLPKPIQIQKLFEVLQKYLGNEIPNSGN